MTPSSPAQETAALLRRVAHDVAPPSARPRVLLVLVGLLRHWQAGWLTLRRNLLDANPGVLFDVVLSTDATRMCTQRDPGCRCMSTPSNLRSAAAALYTINGSVRFLELHTTAAAPLTHWERLSAVWHASVSSLVARRKYHHLLLARPDAGLPHPLVLSEVCARHPGFSLLSGGGAATLSDWPWTHRLLLPRPEGVHNHDWDFGALACNRPALLALWLVPWHRGAHRSNLSCAALLRALENTTTPTLPPKPTLASAARGFLSSQEVSTTRTQHGGTGNRRTPTNSVLFSPSACGAKPCAARAPAEFGADRFFSFGTQPAFCTVSALFRLAQVYIVCI